MRILYIYRSKDSGPSIRRVFQPIQREISLHEDVDALYLPTKHANLSAIIKNTIFVIRHLNKNHYDIIHITGDVYYLLLFLKRYTTVVTVHDLGFYTNNKPSFHRWIRYQFWIKPLLLASHVTFISEKSRKEGRALLTFNDKKVSVIRNAYDGNFAFSPKVPNKGCPNILHIGTKPNKNLPRVIEALSGLRCSLSIIGPLSETDKESLNTYEIHYQNCDNISDEQLLEEYIQSDIVCFPSLFEGFGMPIIEAQAVGRPVVTSDVSPMNEIAGAGAILVNPYSVQSIRDGFAKAISNYETVVECGRRNVSSYSVQYIAHEYMQLYHTLKC